MLADFPYILCPRKTFNSLPSPPPLPGHTWRTHGASSSSRFKPYGKQQRAKVRGDEQSQLLAGLQGWFGERPTIPCSVSWTSHYYRRVLSGAICKVLVNYKPCAFLKLYLFYFFGDACVIDLRPPARCERSFAIYTQLTHSLGRLFIVTLPSEPYSLTRGQLYPSALVHVLKGKEILTSQSILRKPLATLCIFAIFPNKVFLRRRLDNLQVAKKLHFARSCQQNKIFRTGHWDYLQPRHWYF